MKTLHRGVIIPMVTPFDEKLEVDIPTLRRLTNYLIEGGVHGIFPCGSTGEFFSLTPDEQGRILGIVVEEAAGRVPVYAGTGAISTKEAIHLTQMAEECGADATLVITPFYLVPSDEELYEHYAAIASSTSLPVILYSNPARTGVKVSVDVIVRLAEIKNFVGIKDSCGDVGITAQYVVDTPDDFSVLQGRDDLVYPSFSVGAVGAVACTGNVAPKLVVELYEAFVAGDQEKSLAAQRRLTPLRHALGLGTFPVVIKEAMSMIGMPVGSTRLPVAPLVESQKEKLRMILKKMEVL